MNSLMIFFFFFLLSGLVTFSLRVPAQEEKKRVQEPDQETIKIETALVPVTFVVKDKKGNFIDGLRKEDFQLLEDGKEQEITQLSLSPFALDVQEPLAVAILNVAGDGLLVSVDTTDIVSRVVNSVDRQTPIGFFWGLTRLHTTQWFTTDKDLQRAAATLRYDDLWVDTGKRYLYRSIREVVPLLNKVADMPGAPLRKKVLFILSEGYTFDSPRFWAGDFWANWFPSNYANAWKAVQAANVTVYGVASDPSRLLSNSVYGPSFLAFQEFVEGVGGKLLSYESKSSKFADVFSELRHSYVLTYYLPEHAFDGKLHKIKIVCRRPEARVLEVRNGYWAVRLEDLPAGKEGASLRTLGKAESQAEQVFVDLPSKREGGEPIRASLAVEQSAKVPSGQTSVNLNLTFEMSSLRPTVEITPRWLRARGYGGRPFVMNADFNYDLWFEVYGAGESSPLRQWQRNLNISLKAEELRAYKERGIEWREAIVLPPGHYKVRAVAMEPSTLRSVELTTVLVIGGAEGVENPSVRAPYSAGDPYECSAPSALLPAIRVKPAGGEDLNAAGKKPLGMTLLLDANERTTKDTWDQLATSVGQFLPALSPEDLLEVKSASSRVEKVLSPTIDHILSVEAIKRIKPAVSDATRADGYQAILCSARESAELGESRPVIVWLTDLNDSFKDYFQLIYAGQYWNGREELVYKDYGLTVAPYNEASRAVREKAIRVYAVELPNTLPKFRIWEEIRKNREKQLQKFAEATGGRLIKVSRIEEVEAALRDIVREQREAPREPGKERRR